MEAESGLDLWRMATMVIAGVSVSSGGWIFRLASRQHATEEWRKTVEARLKHSAKMSEAVIAATENVKAIGKQIDDIKTAQATVLAVILKCPKITGTKEGG